MPLVYSPELPLVYTRLFRIAAVPKLMVRSINFNPSNNSPGYSKQRIKGHTSPTYSIWKRLLRAASTPKIRFSIWDEKVLEKVLGNSVPIGTKSLKADRSMEIADIADAIRRRNKRTSEESRDNKRAVGKKRMKRSVEQKVLMDSNDGKRNAHRQAEKTKDVRSSEKLTVNASFVAATPNLDVTNSGVRQFKIVVPPTVQERHKYVPVFRDCNEKNSTSKEEPINTSELKQIDSEEVNNNRETNSSGSFGELEEFSEGNEESHESTDDNNVRRTAIDLSTESREGSNEEKVDKSVEFIDPVNSSNKTQSIKTDGVNVRHNITDDLRDSKDSPKNGRIRVNIESSAEESDQNSPQLHRPNSTESSEEERDVVDKKQDEEEDESKEERAKESKGPKFETLLFDINEYRKPFNLDDFLENDPIFKQIDEAMMAKKSVKQNSEDKSSEKPLLARNNVREETDSSENVPKLVRDSEESKEADEEASYEDKHRGQSGEVRENEGIITKSNIKEETDSTEDIPKSEESKEAYEEASYENKSEGQNGKVREDFETKGDIEEETDNSEEVPKSNESEDYEEARNKNEEDIEEQISEVREVPDEEEKEGTTEMKNSNEDFLRSILKNQKKSSPAKKQTGSYEDEDKFLSQYFAADIIDKFRENSNDEERIAKENEHQEEIYDTLSNILGKRDSAGSEKVKAEAESPRAYKSFWSLEYTSPYTEGEQQAKKV